jgi:hypothetical protein
VSVTTYNSSCADLIRKRDASDQAVVCVKSSECLRNTGAAVAAAPAVDPRLPSRWHIAPGSGAELWRQHGQLWHVVAGVLCAGSLSEANSVRLLSVIYCDTDKWTRMRPVEACISGT